MFPKARAACVDETKGCCFSDRGTCIHHVLMYTRFSMTMFNIEATFGRLTPPTVGRNHVKFQPLTGHVVWDIVRFVHVTVFFRMICYNPVKKHSRARRFNCKQDRHASPGRETLYEISVFSTLNILQITSRHA